MDPSTGSSGPAGFSTQANALLRKNLCFQVALLALFISYGSWRYGLQH
jgi:hypothetical protein